ncbi:E3 binding domain-containing protein, partial [Aeromicrobium sp. PE09-221]|uniref:E3 binding domain-containing protein n=1 Tax=Aeromicrobium sp. PE09-221 TaxID=1898043 RepID=UPI001482F837
RRGAARAGSRWRRREASSATVDTGLRAPTAGARGGCRGGGEGPVGVGAGRAGVGSGGAAPAESSEPAEEPEPEEEPEEQPDENPEPEAKPQAEPELEAKPEAEEPKPAQEQPKAEESSGSSSGDEGYVTPIVRKLAKQHGVDLTSLTGSGVGGRIRKQDVLDAAKKAEQPEPAAASSAPSSSAPAPSTEVSALRGKTEKLSRLRKTIAKRLTESLEVSAQLTQVHEVDVTEVVRLRNQHKDAFGEREG